MTNIKTDQAIAFVLSTAIIMSFGVVMDVDAEPVFPPQPHDARAVFNESAEASSTTFSGPWYRPAAQTETQQVEFSVEDASRGYMIANRSIGPWYRPVN